jgi:hypothetical protein
MTKETTAVIKYGMCCLEEKEIDGLKYKTFLTYPPPPVPTTDA